MERALVLLLKIRSPAILAGALYAFAFVLLLPFALAQRQGVLTFAEIVLLAVLAALGVHFLLNWIYYLVVIVPALMASVFFVIGLAIWLTAPLVNVFNILGEAFGIPLSSLMQPISEFITRLGQTGMIIGGGLWWLTQRLGRVNYQALVVYIMALVVVGLLLGAIEPSTVVVSLLFWGVVYLRIQGEQDVGQLRTLFQALATLLILVGVNNVEVVNQAGPVGLSGTHHVSAGWVIYKWFLAVAGWAAI